MKNYTVTIPVIAKVNVEVDADTSEEALHKVLGWPECNYWEYDDDLSLADLTSDWFHGIGFDYYNNYYSVTDNETGKTMPIEYTKKKSREYFKKREREIFKEKLN